MNPAEGGGDPAEYGDRIADVYDEWHGRRDPVDTVVEFLAGWAAGGPALELGIGTGRIALPLAARGIRVDGIDASAQMVARLQAKVGQLTMDNELLGQKCQHLEGGRPFVTRRRGG